MDEALKYDEKKKIEINELKNSYETEIQKL